MQKAVPATRKPAPSGFDLGAYRIADPEAFGRNMLRLMEEGQKVINGFLERADGKTGPYSTASEMTDAAKLFSDVAQPWLANPARLVEAQGALFSSYLQLVTGSARRARAGSGLPGVPVAVAEPDDIAAVTDTAGCRPSSRSSSWPV